MTRLIILGAGGHGSVVADAALLQKKWTEILFLDDSWPVKHKLYEWLIVGKLNDFLTYIDDKTEFIVAIGNGQARYTWLSYLQDKNAKIATVVHPSAVVSPYAKVDQGVVVFANVVVNIGACIGFGCIINTSATVDHDVKLSYCVHVCPGVNLAGGITVGALTWIGIGTAVKQMINIGSNVMIGAGAAVVADIPNQTRVVGVPAKVK